MKHVVIVMKAFPKNLKIPPIPYNKATKPALDQINFIASLAEVIKLLPLIAISI